MNKFGRLFTVTIFGESHGKSVGIIIDGCPAGLPISPETLRFDLERRKSKGTTSRKESDEPQIVSGIFNGKTTGSPIMISFENKDIDSTQYEILKNRPRPGHADLVAKQKFGYYNDYRGGGHFSGRLTTGIVAAGVIAKTLISPININAILIQNNLIDIDNIPQKDSTGGIIQCCIKKLPPGLGEPFFDSVESVLSHGIFSIPGIKGIEFGSGFSSVTMYGSQYNDEIIDNSGTTLTNHCGGINGGITNGNEIIFKVAVRPTASIIKPQNTIDLETCKKTKISIQGRHDSCIALRMPIIIEAMTAITFADLMLIEQKIKRVIGKS